MPDLFDLSSTDDLPETMIPSVTPASNSVTSKARLMASLMSGAGPVTVPQIRAALYRAEGLSVSAATVRSYLAAAVDAGLVERPTRQTYVATGVAAETVDDGGEGEEF